MPYSTYAYLACVLCTKFQIRVCHSKATFVCLFVDIKVIDVVYDMYAMCECHTCYVSSSQLIVLFFYYIIRVTFIGRRWLSRIKSLNTLPKGGFFKDERSVGGRGGQPNAVSISNNDVIV